MSASSASEPPLDIRPDAFPIRTRNITSPIAGIHTTISTVSFADRTVITISQEGQLNHWLHVPVPDQDLSQLSHSSQRFDDSDEVDEEHDSGMLPLPQITPVTLLGGTIAARATVGQVLAAKVASTLTLTKGGHGGRSLVFGLGLVKEEIGKEEFETLVDLILETL